MTITKKRINDLEIENNELFLETERLRASLRQYKQLPTLRDQYAMAAMNGLLSDVTVREDAPVIAKYAYVMADAMLDARTGASVQ